MNRPQRIFAKVIYRRVLTSAVPSHALQRFCRAESWSGASAATSARKDAVLSPVGSPGRSPAAPPPEQQQPALNEACARITAASWLLGGNRQTPESDSGHPLLPCARLLARARILSPLSKRQPSMRAEERNLKPGRTGLEPQVSWGGR